MESTITALVAEANRRMDRVIRQIETEDQAAADCLEPLTYYSEGGVERITATTAEDLQEDFLELCSMVEGRYLVTSCTSLPMGFTNGGERFERGDVLRIDQINAAIMGVVEYWERREGIA